MAADGAWRVRATATVTLLGIGFRIRLLYAVACACPPYCNLRVDRARQSFRRYRSASNRNIHPRASKCIAHTVADPDRLSRRACPAEFCKHSLVATTKNRRGYVDGVFSMILLAIDPDRRCNVPDWIMRVGHAARFTQLCQDSARRAGGEGTYVLALVARRGYERLLEQTDLVTVGHFN